MRVIIILFGWLLTGVAYGQAQQKWDLERCVDYAIANNISIAQSKVQERVSELTYEQSKLARWPNASFSLAYGLQNGRSIDPTTNQFISQQVGVVNPQLQSSVTVFNFFSQKNTIAANELALKAAGLQTESIKNNIVLNVTAAYLQALLAHEQTEIAQVQVRQTTEQLNTTQKRVAVGDVPELNAVILEAQLATDSATFLNARSQYELSLLAIKNALNLDAATPFSIVTPPIEHFPVLTLAELAPELVYSMAAQNQALQKANELRFLSAKKNTAAANAQRYPTLGAFVNFNSSYSTSQKFFNKGTPNTVFQPSGLYVPLNGVNHDVFAPGVIYPEMQKANITRQFDRNFRQSFGLNLSVPIFTGGQTKTNWRKTQLNEQSAKLQMLSDSLVLKQNIYQAYQNALTALQTFNSRKRAVDASQKSYDLGKKRFELGLLPTLELVTLQSNLQKAKIDKASAQYDYVFRLKILEFYKNNNIKL